VTPICPTCALSDQVERARRDAGPWYCGRCDVAFERERHLALVLAAREYPRSSDDRHDHEEILDA
jgi:ribosomal protein L37AE/L43A